MSVVVVKGFVRDARLNGVREVAFTAALRFAHPKPSSQAIFPLCATATATPVAVPLAVALSMRSRTGSKSCLSMRVADEVALLGSRGLAGRMPPIDADSNAYRASRRVNEVMEALLLSRSAVVAS